MKEDDIRKKLNEAFNLFIKNEKYLLENNVNERTISAKFAMYLQKEFDVYSVDCEYNKDIIDKKVIKLDEEEINTIADIAKEEKETNEKILNEGIEAVLFIKKDSISVYPDIVIHKRNSNKNNLLIIEVKKDISREDKKDRDEKKLILYKRQLGYKHACLLTFFTKHVDGNNFENCFRFI